MQILINNYIIEFMDLKKFVHQRGSNCHGEPLFSGGMSAALGFAALIYRAGRLARGCAARSPGCWRSRSPSTCRPRWFWSGVVIVLASVLNLPGAGASPRMIELGQFAPIGLVALGAWSRASCERRPWRCGSWRR